MKRILFMHHSSSIGGGSYCLLNVIKALDRQQYEPVVAIKSEGALADELYKMGLEVVFFRQMSAVPYNRSLCNPASIISYLEVLRSLNPFAKLLTEVNCDVVYLNNMMIYPYLRIAKQNGKRTVIHVREHWPLNEHVIQLNWARKTVNSYADKLIAINQFSASMFPSKTASIVYDWIDMDSRYKPIPFSDIFKEDMKGKKVLLYTGGLSSIKGTNYVLESFVHSVKGEDYRLLVLGVEKLPLLAGWKHKLKVILDKFGYYYYDKRMQELLSADKRIKYIPAVYELTDIIKQSFCFVSYFGIPHANLALAENLVLENPCIVAETEESREYSNEGRFAMLIKPMNNQSVFTVRLNEFLEHIDQWQKAAKDGAVAVKTMFSPEKNIAILNDTLGEL